MRRVVLLLGVLACSRPVTTAPTAVTASTVVTAPVDAGRCVPPDGDGDGVVDVCDVCPDEPGARPDGCAPRVEIQAAEIRITPQVFFAANAAAVPPPGAAALDAIAEVLRAHPEIRSLELGGHASVGERGASALALRRAEAARAYLLAHGVQGERLVARGYGVEDPADAGVTAEARARNRRVVFRLVAVDRPPAAPERPRRWVPEGCPDAPTVPTPCAVAP